MFDFVLRFMKKRCIGYISFVLMIALCMLGGCNNKTIEGIESVSGDLIVSENQLVAEVSENVITGINEFSDEELLVYNNVLDLIDENEECLNNMGEGTYPFALAGSVISGYSRDIFFANGTPITIVGTKADVSEYVHDIELQDALGNGLDDDNKGFGAIVLWEDEEVTYYVYVSNMAEIFGGTLNADLRCDTSVVLDGNVKSSSAPNVSYVFGGSLGGDIYGNVSVSVNEAQPMYLCGGGLNGDVYGNISIDYLGSCWSYYVWGGGMAYAIDSDASAFVYGDISMNIIGDKMNDINIMCGGFSMADNGYYAFSNVIGNVYLDVSATSDSKIHYTGGVNMANSGIGVSDVFGRMYLDEETYMDPLFSSSANFVGFDAKSVFDVNVIKLAKLEPDEFNPDASSYVTDNSEGANYAVYFCSYKDNFDGNTQREIKYYMYIVNTLDGLYKYKMLDASFNPEDYENKINICYVRAKLEDYVERVRNTDMDSYLQYKSSGFNPDMTLALLWYGQ